MVAPKFLQITWISGIMNFYDFLGISMFRQEKGQLEKLNAHLSDKMHLPQENRCI